MFDTVLSHQQIEVISALSDGATSQHAAAQAGVHRNTIANWRRNYLPFREALAHAQYDRAMLYREKAEEMLELAFQTLQAILTDPKATAAARLKSATFIIEKATTPPPQKEQVPLDILKVNVNTGDPVTINQNAEIVPPVHNDAQPTPRPEPVPAPPVTTIRHELFFLYPSFVCL